MKVTPIEKVKDVGRRIRRNDAKDRLQFATIFFSFGIVCMSYLASLGVESARIALNLGVWIFYGPTNLGYTVSKTLSDRTFYRKEAKKSEESAKELIIQRSRGGQYVGLAFVLLLLLQNILVAFRVSIPWNIGEGQFVLVDEATWIAIGITVAIIGAASVAKIIQREQARYTHNALLLYMTTASTLVYAVWIAVAAFGGTIEVPTDYFWLYTSILITYVGHNMILNGWLKEEDKKSSESGPQKHWGDLVGLIGGLLFSFVILVLYGFNDLFATPVVKQFPTLDIILFFISTLVIFVVSISRPDWAAEVKAWRRRQKKHEEENHSAGSPSKCKDCKEDSEINST